MTDGDRDHLHDHPHAVSPAQLLLAAAVGVLLVLCGLCAGWVFPPS